MESFRRGRRLLGLARRRAETATDRRQAEAEQDIEDGNVLRDRQQYDVLERMGWSALVIWECETTGAERLAA